MALFGPIYGTVSIVNVGAASGTVVVPATASVGDRLLLVVAYGGGNPVIGASGITGGAGQTWTSTATFPVGDTAPPGTGLDILTVVAQAGDIGATLTVNFSGSTSKAIMWVVAWHDPNGTPTVDQSSGKWSSTAASALTSNSITPSVVGCWVMSVFTQRAGTAVTFTPGTDSGSGATLTERDDQTNTGSSQVAAELCDTNGAVSSGVATQHSSTSTASLAYCAGILAIAPASVAAAVVVPPFVSQYSGRW